MNYRVPVFLLALALTAPAALSARADSALPSAATIDQATTSKLVYGLLSDSRYAYRPRQLDAAASQDVVKRYLPKACQTVSYVAQLSASMFRPDHETWSGHIFMMLDKPAEEKHLRAWLESLNFTNKELFAQLRLSDSQQALHWPLDRTVAYNSKLIFIAPPKCYGFDPAIEESITLVKKAKPTLTIPQFEKIETSQIKQRINDLRSEVGLDPISYDTTVFEDTLVLREAAEVVLHDVKTSGDNYIRFNLNGGDSYAYFIDLP